jgi:hypothetical protein
MSTLKNVKCYDDLSHKQWIALGNKCGGLENVLAVLCGEMKITVEEAIRLLIDKNGRGIPQPEVTARVCDPNLFSFFDRLAEDFNLQELVSRFEVLFGKTEITNDLGARLNAIKENLLVDPRIANLLNGPYFPIILPQIPKGDYGTMLESLLLPVVDKAYTEAFPDRKFVNRRGGALAGQVKIVDERHAQLIADLENGPIVGIFFPSPLQGFLVKAQRQMANLTPENLSLAGPIEYAVSLALYPKQLARGTNTPYMDCSAVQWCVSSYSLYFIADDDKLSFVRRGDLDYLDADSTGGFFARG